MSKGSARKLQYWLDKGYDEVEAERMRLSRTPGTIEYFTIFKKMNYEDAVKAREEFQSNRAITLENMIRKYGDVEGEIRWQHYKDKQAYTNSYEYKRDKYGWSYDDWIKYNKSLGNYNYNPNNFHQSITKNWIDSKNEEYYRRKFDEKKEYYGWDESDWDEYLNQNGNYTGKFNPLTNGQYYNMWVKKYGKDKADDMEQQYRQRRATSNKNQIRTNETRTKMRLSYIAYLEQRLNNGGQLSPNYNVNSIPIIEGYAHEYGYNIQHAENGGEYYISELGYWVDGYDSINNVVIEYDEAHHFNNDGSYIERDVRRQSEIQSLLKCKFIRIDYLGSIKIFDYCDK
jgi:hypothetical protein